VAAATCCRARSRGRPCPQSGASSCRRRLNASSLVPDPSGSSSPTRARRGGWSTPQRALQHEARYRRARRGLPMRGSLGHLSVRARRRSSLRLARRRADLAAHAGSSESCLSSLAAGEEGASGRLVGANPQRRRCRAGRASLVVVVAASG